MVQKKLYTVFNKLRRFILDILFPIVCISCGKDGKWICEDCAARVFIQSEYVCGVCEKVNTPDGKTCQKCKKKSALGALVVATSYTDSFIAHAVHFYKYRFIPSLHVQLGDLMIKSLQKTDIPLAELIVPVPLHPKRLRWRGFNQSSLLAGHIALNLLPQTQLELDEKALIRKKYTSPQMKINNFLHRKQNVRGAFCVINPKKIKGKIILLVDDIATTGSTIFECAQVLKDSGAKDIYAAVIARQEIKKH